MVRDLIRLFRLFRTVGGENMTRIIIKSGYLRLAKQVVSDAIPDADTAPAREISEISEIRPPEPPVMHRPAADEEAWWAGLYGPDPDEVDAVIEPGYWHVGDPPEAPPAWDDEPSLQDRVDAALAGTELPHGWPGTYAAFLARNPRPAVSPAAALRGLERHIAAVRVGAAENG